jgi:hypothetical protein
LLKFKQTLHSLAEHKNLEIFQILKKTFLLKKKKGQKNDLQQEKSKMLLILVQIGVLDLENLQNLKKTCLF